MVEELKIIAEIFSNATNSALIAYSLYLLTPLIKTAMIVIPVYKGFTFLISRMFVNETK